MDRATRLEQAATQAVELIEQYSEQDPQDPNSAWKNPQEIFEKLDVARKEVLAAWNDMQESQNNTNEQIDESAFRALYLDMITDAFADVLDELRKDNAVDVSVLVDCLQSGMDFLTSEEKELFLQDDMEDEEELTPHEKHRRDLGFHVAEVNS
jgi:hypothetical protein